MNKIDNNHQAAIIMLHEIYGINPFIKTLAAEYQQQGFAVYCPNLLKREAFSYARRNLPMTILTVRSVLPAIRRL